MIAFTYGRELVMLFNESVGKNHNDDEMNQSEAKGINSFLFELFLDHVFEQSFLFSFLSSSMFLHFNGIIHLIHQLNLVVNLLPEILNSRENLLLGHMSF